MLCLCVSYASAECVSVRYTKIVYIYFDFVGAIRFTVKKCWLLFSSAACSNLCVWICCDGCVHIWSKAKNKLEKIINIDCFFFRLLFLSWSVSSDRCNLICFLAFIEMIAVCVCDTLSTLNYLIVFLRRYYPSKIEKLNVETVLFAEKDDDGWLSREALFLHFIRSKIDLWFLGPFECKIIAISLGWLETTIRYVCAKNWIIVTFFLSRFLPNWRRSTFSV